MKSRWVCWIIAVLLTDVCIASDYEDKKEDYGTVIGIDLGTTYSCVGVFIHGRVEIIANDLGNRVTPSYVAFTAEGSRLIGEAAVNQLTSNPENTVFNVKRLIGRRWGDPEVQKDIESFPFKVINKNGKPNIQVKVGLETKTFAPEEISAMILGKMKETAEAFLGKKVTHAIVTVPAYFNNNQRQATKDAGAIAGLTVMRLYNEPTAAAVAYGLDKKDEKSKILVYDLGGGTFDVSLLNIENGVFKVLSTSGDTHLGGEDFDQRVVDYFIKQYEEKKGKTIHNNIRAIQKLRQEVEKAKRHLSGHFQARIEIESYFDGEDFSESLTRAKFEELNLELFESTLGPVRQVLDDAGLKPNEIDEIVLVGGSTRILKVQELVTNLFNGKEPSRGINPDEAVAYGAAVQAGVLSGEESLELILLDVNPLTLGIESNGGVMVNVINRNTVIPTKQTHRFTTVYDYQEEVSFPVYEGERPLVKDNNFLGSFLLTGITSALRGVPTFIVTFDIDADGILIVTAEDKGTGSKNKIRIDNQNKLPDEEVDKMVNDASKFAEIDKEVKKKIKIRHTFENYIYSLKKQINNKHQLGGKLNKSEKSEIKNALDELTKWIEENFHVDLNKFKTRGIELTDALKQIAENLYRRTREQLPLLEIEEDQEEPEYERDEL